MNKGVQTNEKDPGPYKGNKPVFPEGHASDVNFERQVTTTPSESVSSVEIKQTTKGTTFTVKVYNVDPDVATKKAATIFDDLGKKYPQVKA